MKKSLSIYFNGGTGGNYALWLILLGTDYKCHFKNFSFNDSNDLSTLYKFCWDKEFRNHWAAQELQIDVEKTLNDQSIDKKVLLFGDGDVHRDFKEFDQNIVIYTNTFAQSMLSIEKQTAYGMLSNIDFRDKILHLDAATHLAKLMPTVDFLNQKISSYYKNTIDISKADAAFDLIDLVKQNGAPLINYLGYPCNELVDNFTKKYIQLHSPLCQELFK